MAIDALEKEMTELRLVVKTMRELGIIQYNEITLGPEPRIPTKLETLEKKAATDATPEAKRDARVENAREEIRAKLGNWDLSAAAIDKLLDPAVFELE